MTEYNEEEVAILNFIYFILQYLVKILLKRISFNNSISSELNLEIKQLKETKKEGIEHNNLNGEKINKFKIENEELKQKLKESEKKLEENKKSNKTMEIKLDNILKKIREKQNIETKINDSKVISYENESKSNFGSISKKLDYIVSYLDNDIRNEKKKFGQTKKEIIQKNKEGQKTNDGELKAVRKGLEKSEQQTSEKEVKNNKKIKELEEQLEKMKENMKNLKEKNNEEIKNMKTELDHKNQIIQGLENKIKENESEIYYIEIINFFNRIS